MFFQFSQTYRKKYFFKSFFTKNFFVYSQYMVKIENVNTKEVYIFDDVQQAADFLHMKKPSVYTKFRSGRTNDGYKVVQLDMIRGNAGMPRKKDFKRCKIGNHKVEFLENTAIIRWSLKVDEEFDEKLSYIAHKRAVSGILKENPIWDTNFILLTEKSPKDYTGLPAEREDFELYLHFKEKLTAKEKKKAIIDFLPHLS